MAIAKQTACKSAGSMGWCKRTIMDDRRKLIKFFNYHPAASNYEKCYGLYNVVIIIIINDMRTLS